MSVNIISMIGAAKTCSRGFKGLKQATKLEYKLGKYDKVRKPKPVPIALL